jgi:hypothetical protein
MKKPVIRVERRERPAPVEPRYPWLLPLLVGLAVVTLVVIVVYSLATGVFFP